MAVLGVNERAADDWAQRDDYRAGKLSGWHDFGVLCAMVAVDSGRAECFWAF